MLAVLALLASVLMWATPQAVAQNGTEVIDVTSTVSSSTDHSSAADEITVKTSTRVYLSATAVSLPTDAEDIQYKWVIATGPYDYIDINENADPAKAKDDLSTPVASFLLPNQRFVEGVTGTDDQKYEITVTLTASAGTTSKSDTVTIKIAREPVSDITVFAGLPDARYAQAPDANVEEIFGEDAIIDGPGENGNAADEWDIREGAFVRLDGSGSTVTGGTVDSWTWSRLLSDPRGISDLATIDENKINDASDNNDKSIFDVGKVAFNDEITSATYTILPDLPSRSRVRLIYQLSVQAGSGPEKTSRVIIVVHDVPDDVTPINVVPTYTEATKQRLGANAAPQLTSAALNGGIQNQYIVNPGSVVRLTANRVLNNTVRWTGAYPGADDDSEADSGTATRRIPATANAGTTYDVTVTELGGPRRTTTVQLVVGNNQAPTADGVTADGSDIGDIEELIYADKDDSDSDNDLGLNVLAVNDGPQSDGQPITLRGVGNDPDGGSLIEAWALREIPATQANALADAITAWRGSTDDSKNRGDPKVAKTAIDDALKELGKLTADPDNPTITLIDPVGDGTVSFQVPQVPRSTGVFLIYSVTDSAFVTATEMVYLHIRAAGSPPVANAGPNQQVSSGSFVRLNGSASADPDPGDTVDKYDWTYVGAVMSPLPGRDGLGALTNAEIAELDGWVVREVTSENPAPANTNTFKGPDNKDYMFIVNASGNLLTGHSNPSSLKGATSPYPYFDAPKLGRFTSITLTFHLRVTDDKGTENDASDDEVSDPSPVAITVAQVESDQFYSGFITGPDFCTNRSFGGPMLYAYDGDGDRVAETCSLNTTRRATVARQNALETIANLNLVQLANEVRSQCTALKARGASYEGDSADDLKQDVCETNRLATTPVVSDTTKFGPVITGPDFCTNFSLGGPVTYPHDSDGDGIYDICSLNSTRREAVARQAALATFEVQPLRSDAQTQLNEQRAELNRLRPLLAQHKDPNQRPPIDVSSTTLVDESDEAAVEAEINRLVEASRAAAQQEANAIRYANALAAACRALVGQDFGDKAADLATDGCAPRAAAGVALPS